MKGRGNHEPELFTCATYIANEFEEIGLQKPLSSQSYYQPFPAKAYNKLSSSGNFNNDVLFNIVGFLPGRTKPEEIVIFSAHYDHVGFDSMRGKDKIFNGANDNASGTAAMLALANSHTIMASDDDDRCYHETCDEVKRMDFDNMTEIVKAIAASCATIISGEQTPTVTDFKDWH